VFDHPWGVSTLGDFKPARQWPKLSAPTIKVGITDGVTGPAPAALQPHRSAATSFSSVSHEVLGV
jgi:hypothetical protein